MFSCFLVLFLNHCFTIVDTFYSVDEQTGHVKHNNGTQKHLTILRQTLKIVVSMLICVMMQCKLELLTIYFFFVNAVIGMLSLRL